MSVFKAYDIRGIWGKEIDEDLCYKAGYFLPGLLGANEVIVGRDIRLSSEAAHQALVQGITDSGADVLDLGLSTSAALMSSTWGSALPRWYALPLSICQQGPLSRSRHPIIPRNTTG